MSSRIFAVLLAAIAIAFLSRDAKAGAIRYAGEKIGTGSAAVVHATVDGVATAGKATGGAFATGGVAFAKGVKATPGVVARGAKATGKGLLKAIW
jgi:hypothetical protein